MPRGWSVPSLEIKDISCFLRLSLLPETGTYCEDIYETYTAKIFTKSLPTLAAVVHKFDMTWQNMKSFN